MSKYRVLNDEGQTSFQADNDLTTHQYKFLAPASTAGNVKIATGASNPAALGVLQNSPSAGEGAAVTMIGFCKLKGRVNACDLRANRFVLCASDGFAEVPATIAGSPVKAIWLGPTITSGSVIGEAFIFPSTTCHVSAS